MEPGGDSWLREGEHGIDGLGWFASCHFKEGGGLVDGCRGGRRRGWRIEDKVDMHSDEEDVAANKAVEKM